jgi:hypothetical protein
MGATPRAPEKINATPVSQRIAGRFHIVPKPRNAVEAPGKTELPAEISRPTIERVDPGEAVDNIRSLGAGGDRIATELVNALDRLEKTNPERWKSLSENSRLLEQYQIGLAALGLNSHASFQTAKFRNDEIKLAEINAVLGSLAEREFKGSIDYIECIALLGQRIETIQEINKTLGNVISQRQIERNDIDPLYISAILLVTRYCMRDDKALAEIEQIVNEIGRANSYEAIPVLKEIIINSRADSPAELKNCEIASSCLASLGEEGFNALLGIYPEVAVSTVKRAIHRMLLRIDYSHGQVVLNAQIKEKILAIIFGSQNGDLLAINLLRAFGLSDPLFLSESEFQEIYRLIKGSENDRAKRISGLSDRLFKILNEGHAEEKLTVIYTAFIKAILAEYGIDLTDRLYPNEALEVLQKALTLGKPGSAIPEIHYALAYNYFGLGSELSRQHLEKGIELDTDDLTDLFMHFGMVGEIGDERNFMAFANHYIVKEMPQKAAVLLALGYVTHNKFQRFGEESRAREFIQALLAEQNAVLWNALVARLNKGGGEFTQLLNLVASKIEKDAPQTTIQHISVAQTSFADRVQTAIGKVIEEEGLE